MDPTAGLDVVAKRFRVYNPYSGHSQPRQHSNTLGHLSNSNIIKMIMTLTMMMIIIIMPLWRNNINSQLDATIIILLIISTSSTCFRR